MTLTIEQNVATLKEYVESVVKQPVKIEVLRVEYGIALQIRPAKEDTTTAQHLGYMLGQWNSPLFNPRGVIFSPDLFAVRDEDALSRFIQKIIETPKKEVAKTVHL